MNKFLVILALAACTNITARAESSISDEKVWDLRAAQDKILSAPGVTFDTDNSSDGEGSYMVQSGGITKVELYELNHLDISNSRAVYRAMLRTQGLLPANDDSRGIAYLEMVVTFADGHELVSRGPRVPPGGTSAWQPAETILYIDRGDNPDTVRLNLVVDGKGKAWIDDVSLTTRPLRLGYLFWGHVVVWAALLIYIYDLLRKNRKLRRELDSLKR